MGSGAGPARKARRRRDNGDSSAYALVDVLAAEGGEDGGFQAPSIAEFYPTPLFEFSVLGVDFSITRITIIMWIATLAIIALHSREQ